MIDIESFEASQPFKNEFYERMKVDDLTIKDTVEALKGMIVIPKEGERPYFSLERFRLGLKDINDTSQDFLKKFRKGIDFNAPEYLIKNIRHQQLDIKEHHIIGSIKVLEYTIAFVKELERRIIFNDYTTQQKQDEISSLSGRKRQIALKSVKQNKGISDADKKIISDLSIKKEEYESLVEKYKVKNSKTIADREIVEGYELEISPDVKIFWTDEDYLDVNKEIENLEIPNKESWAYRIIEFNRASGGMIQIQIRSEDRVDIMHLHMYSFLLDREPYRKDKMSTIISNYDSLKTIERKLIYIHENNFRYSRFKICYDVLMGKEIEAMNFPILQEFLNNYTEDQQKFLLSSNTFEEFLQLCRSSNENAMVFPRKINLGSAYRLYEKAIKDSIALYPNEANIMELDLMYTGRRNHPKWLFNNHLQSSENTIEILNSLFKLESTIIPKDIVDIIEDTYPDINDLDNKKSE